MALFPALNKLRERNKSSRSVLSLRPERWTSGRDGRFRHPDQRLHLRGWSQTSWACH